MRWKISQLSPGTLANNVMSQSFLGHLSGGHPSSAATRFLRPTLWLITKASRFLMPALTATPNRRISSYLLGSFTQVNLGMWCLTYGQKMSPTRARSMNDLQHNKGYWMLFIMS